MIRGSLDTSVLLRLILNDIPSQHQQARQLLDYEGQFRVSDLALIEIIFVLERNYKMKRTDIAVVIRGLLSNSKLITDDLVLLALDDFVNHLSLSFEDCYLAAQAEFDKSKPLYTFGKKLAHQIENVELVG